MTRDDARALERTLPAVSAGGSEWEILVYPELLAELAARDEALAIGRAGGRTVVQAVPAQTLPEYRSGTTTSPLRLAR